MFNVVKALKSQTSPSLFGTGLWCASVRSTPLKLTAHLLKMSLTCQMSTSAMGIPHHPSTCQVSKQFLYMSAKAVLSFYGKYKCLYICYLCVVAHVCHFVFNGKVCLAYIIKLLENLNEPCVWLSRKDKDYDADDDYGRTKENRVLSQLP